MNADFAISASSRLPSSCDEVKWRYLKAPATCHDACDVEDQGERWYLREETGAFGPKCGNQTGVCNVSQEARDKESSTRAVRTVRPRRCQNPASAAPGRTDERNDLPAQDATSSAQSIP